MFCLNHKQDMKRRNFNYLNRSFWVNENMNDSNREQLFAFRDLLSSADINELVAFNGCFNNHTWNVTSRIKLM